MKNIIGTLLMVTIFACQSSDKSNSSSSKDGKSASSLNGAKCFLDEWQNEHSVVPLAKSIYQGGDWSLTNDEEVLSLLDSLEAQSDTAQTYYFKVVTLSYRKSDGYYSEALGNAGVSYTESHTSAFLSMFEHTACFSSADLETWADIVMLEFSLNADEEDAGDVVASYCDQILSASKSLSTGRQQTARLFVDKVQGKWKALQDGVK